MAAAPPAPSAPVAARVPALQAPAVGPAAIATTTEAERRQLTVMFCDLVGSTTLSTGLDPEDLRDVDHVISKSLPTRHQALRWFHREVHGRDRHPGIFRLSARTEDDAQRSARAGLDIVGGMAEFNAELGKRHKVELAVRVGIATGPVIVGDLIGEGAAEEASVVGETPNLSARLQALAQPNQVVISRTTRRMLGDYFELQDLGAHEAQGISRASGGLARIVGARCREPVCGDTDGKLRATCRTPGRDGAAAAGLGRHLRRPRQGRAHPREAGVGKSRLVEGLRQTISEDHTRVAIRSSAFHTASAFHPIIEHLKRVFGWLPEDTVQQRLAKLEGGLESLGPCPCRRASSVRGPDVRAVTGRSLCTPDDDGAAAAQCDYRRLVGVADRGGGARSGAHGVGGSPLG